MSPKVTWLLAFALPLPLVALYFFNLWNVDQYQFFVVLLGSVLAMYYVRWDHLWNLPKTILNWSIFGLGIFSSIIAALIFSPWLAYLCLLILITSFSLVHREKNNPEGHEPISNGNLLYLSLPLWLCLRLPLNYDQSLTIGLQHLTAKISSFCLDKLSIPHQVSGVIFELASGKLFVEEACSGVQSLFALLCIGLLFMALNRRPTVLIPAYLAAAVFSSALFNVLRVVIIAASQEWYNIDLAHGWQHALLGYCCLILAILLLASFDRLFRVLFYPIPDDVAPIINHHLPNPLKILWNRLLTLKPDSKQRESQIAPSFPRWQWSALLSIAVLSWSCQLIFGTQHALRERVIEVEPPVGGTEMFWVPGKDLFKQQPDLIVEGFEQLRNGEDISRGQNTDVWMVLDTKTRLRHRIAISQPYDGFHDLCICYEGNGWRIGERRILRQANTSLPVNDWDFIYSNWFNDNGSYGYLSFSGLNRDNTAATIPEETFGDILSNRFALGGTNSGVAKECLMFQVWTTLDSPLSQEDQIALQNLHLRLREFVREELKKSLATSQP